MYDFNQRRELHNPTVGEVIDVLSQYPRESSLVCDGDGYLYIHVEKDQSVVNIDSSGLDEEYEED